MLRKWLDADQPRLLVAGHVLTTGNGACLVDRWPGPRLALAVSGSNYALVGDERAADADALRPHITGSVEATAAFARVLHEVDPCLHEWRRINHLQPAMPAQAAISDADVRRLSAADAGHLQALSPLSSWISDTWGGPSGLAASGMAFGAFVERRLASVACPFFITERFEDLGVVTEPEFRGRGLSPACAAAVCADVRKRGRQPSWTTLPDNSQSLRVAEKLGFVEHHREVLWVIRHEVPKPADLPGAP